MWASVTSTDMPCSHLKRLRSPRSVAALMAGISNWRKGTVVMAMAAISPDATASRGHYRGVLAVSGDAGVRAFAHRHLAAELEHLRLVTPILPWPQRSRLLVPWRAAGFLTGALPALAGARAVYGTIAAVETFVDHHYQQQIDHIDALRAAEGAAAAPLRALLTR